MTFSIALTGINAASTDLSTISNNIANNATTGFKRSRAEFADVYSQSAFSSAKSTVGQGVRVSEIRQEHNQGDMQMTNRNLDLAVGGLGMFQLNDNGTSLYTRSGNFSLDREGFIVDTQGNNLTGYGVDSNAKILPIISDLQIDYADLSPSQSSKIALTANLDSRAMVPGMGIDDEGEPTGSALDFDPNDSETYNFSTSTLVYDSLGASEVANLYFQKSAPNAWTAFPVVGNQIVEPDGFDLKFNPANGNLDTAGPVNYKFDTQTYNPASGGAEMTLNFNLSDIRQNADASGVNTISQDGFAGGRLDDFDIDSEGVILGRYTNGESKQMGQVALSNFTNESGLQQVGNTNWTATHASGEPATGVPGSANLGNLQSGALEGSNVDITQELVSMITAQRSFQANAKVISTGDTLTQTVINIGR